MHICWCIFVPLMKCVFSDEILERVKARQEAELDEVKRRTEEKASQGLKVGEGSDGDNTVSSAADGFVPQQDSEDGNAASERTGVDGKLGLGLSVLLNVMGM